MRISWVVINIKEAYHESSDEVVALLWLFWFSVWTGWKEVGDQHWRYHYLPRSQKCNTDLSDWVNISDKRSELLRTNTYEERREETK